jgi:hypothetical protein
VPRAFDDQTRALLDGKSFATVATLGPDGPRQDHPPRRLTTNRQIRAPRHSAPRRAAPPTRRHDNGWPITDLPRRQWVGIRRFIGVER